MASGTSVDQRHSPTTPRWRGRGWRLPVGLCWLLMVTSLMLVVTANPDGGAGVLLRSTLDRLERRGEILFDARTPPTPANAHLQKRQLFSSPSSSPSSTSSSPSSSSMSETSSTSTSPPASTSSVVSSPGAGSGSPLPSVFDTSLGANFTSNACPEFFRQFLANAEFRNCLPFSLLLQNSNSFFQASKSVVRVTQTLDATCNVNLDSCSGLMSRLASDIRRDNNCGQDLRDQNPVVVQAYNGMIAYQPLYQAGCLKSESGSYCFADAITNTSSPSDSYPYYMPLGLPLPGGSRPACTDCLQKTMSIFAGAASNATQPASRHYLSTAQVINLSCGPNFVNATIPPARGAATTSTPHQSLAGISVLAIFILLASNWFF
ncbi:MAG: hypothetical protein M1823_001487 [Watsoniomyces obsoletus]|nr:MAG: hypothetical protein M1823_001487 [Watsoniomyces obsoletus]